MRHIHRYTDINQILHIIGIKPLLTVNKMRPTIIKATVLKNTVENAKGRTKMLSSSTYLTQQCK